MTRIKYDTNLMNYISLFETLTNTHLKDCINNNDEIVFIVKEGEIGRAIGRNGFNAKKIKNLLKKKIKIVEFSSDAAQFIRNFVYPISPREVRNEGNIITIVGADKSAKGLLIGRESKNLQNLKQIVKRYFPIEDIKVV